MANQGGVAVLEKMVDHFNTDELHEIVIPEWETTFYFKKLTLQDRSNINKKAGGDLFEVAARTIIYAARNSEGERLFDVSDLKTFMLKVDADVVIRVGGHILQKGQGDPDDLEKS